MKGPATVYHHHNHHGTSDRVHISYGAVDVLLPGDDMKQQQRHWSLVRIHQGVLNVLRCMLFLIVNAFAAVVACTVLLAALACATMLLPFCCVGVLVFRLLFRMRLVESLAKSDVMLVNFLSRSEDRIPVEATSENNDPLHPLLRRPNSPLRLASGLDNVSAESLLVLFYFLTIKCICGLLGLCVVVLVLWAPVALLQLLFASVASSGDVTFWESICGVFTLSLVFAVAVFSLDMLVSLSCATTCFFCCEGEAHTLNPHPRPAAVTEVPARPNVMVVRFAPSSASSRNESMVPPRTSVRAQTSVQGNSASVTATRTRQTVL